LKITQDEVVDNQTTLHIELEDEDLSPYLDRGYQRIANQIVIPGFRKGKAPRRVVESMVGRESLLNEVLDSMVFEVIGKVIEERELDSVGIPKVDDLDLDPVQFTAVVPLRPEIDLGAYESIRVEYDDPEVTDEQVSERIQSIRESLGTWETAERPAQFGDMAVINMSSDVDGENRWNGEETSFYMAEDGRYPVPGFSAKLVDLEIDQPAEFSLEIPEDFTDASLAGKEASFNVTVTEVRERVLPELNDEFAQGLPDGFADLDALKSTVMESMASEAEMQTRMEYRDSVIDALLENATFTIPPVVIETEVERIQDSQRRSLENANIQVSDYLAAIGMTEEQAEQEAEEQAEQRVRRSLVINKLADLEAVEVTDPEIDEQFNQLYAGQRMRRQERRDLRNSLSDRLRYDKTIDTLVSIARSERESDDTQNEESEVEVTDSEGDQQDDDSQA
jgi:trigger factor